MEARVARFLAHMHAPEFQARYGAEFEALLVDLPASPAVIADVAGSVFASRRGPIVLGLGVLAVLLAMSLGPPKHQVAAAICRRPAPVVATCAPAAGRLHKAKAPCALG
ncbi:MAG TPA: hypothetical protein VGI19_06500 [Candidatus Cybelea sp.]|jgi:hypothetical protein